MRLMPRTRRRRQAARGMTVIEHLEERRRRLVLSVAAVAVGAVLGWVFYTWVFRWITHPYTHVCFSLPKSIQPPTHCKLVFSGVVEPFLIRVKLAVAAGLAI